MVISDFKKLVSDYMNRDSGIFDSGGTGGQVDKLLLGANNAKKYAQRRMPFERARCMVDVIVDKSSGGALSSAVLHDDGVTSIDVQTVERAYMPTSDNSGLFPVDLVDKDSQYRSLKRRTENVFDPRRNNLPNMPSYPQVMRFGNKIFLQNLDTTLYTQSTVKVSLDVVQWMPAYANTVTGVTTGRSAEGLFNAGATFVVSNVKINDIVTNVDTGATALVTSVTATLLTLSGDIFLGLGGENYAISAGVQEDFFLDNCIDWMLYRTVQELNLFLKEDQRVQISARMMTDTWDTVVSWNARLEKSADDMDLE